jgi:chorismate mutase
VEPTGSALFIYAQEVEMMMICRGIRGATTVEDLDDKADAVLEATKELLEAITAANDLQVENLAAAIFTTTQDLNAAFPARAARDLGWTMVPLLNTQEIAVPGSLPRCIRVLLLWNTDKSQEEIRHIYLRGAKALRPDLQQND